jgi:hypothetical protein
LAVVGTIAAQEFRGTILGRVTDAQQAVIQGVSVAVVNSETQGRTTATTNDTGDYYVP